MKETISALICELKREQVNSKEWADTVEAEAKRYIVSIQNTLKDLKELQKYELASLAHPQYRMVTDMIESLRKTLKGE